VSTTETVTVGAPVIDAAARSRPAASMSHKATGRPTSAKASAVASPIPDAAPVTITPVAGAPSPLTLRAPA